MKKSKSVSLMLITGFLSSLLLLSGCQPTPDQGAVVGKKGTLAAQIAQSPVPEGAYQAPTKWTQEFRDGSLTVKINAEVSVPSVTKYPILKIEPRPFDISYAHALADKYFPGQTLYQLTEYTKSDLDKQILARKQLISQAQSDPSAVFGFGVNESSIADLEQAKANAADHVDKKVSDFTMETSPEGRSLFVQTELGGQISLFNGNNLYNSLRFQKSVSSQGALSDTLMKSDGWDIPFTLDQAIEKADAYLHSIGIKDYRFFEEELGVKVTDAQYDVFAGITTDEKFLEQAEKGYILFYTPCYQGVAKNFSFTDNIVDLQEDTYNELWGDELLRMYVSKDGVEKMEWDNGIGHITETLNENIGLAPFETIQQRFSEQILRTYYTDTINNDCETTLEISHVTLSYRKILVQGQQSEYMLIPAWDFYGQKIMQFAPGADVSSLGLRVNDQNQAIEPYFLHSHVTISAIDGSVIDNIQGY